MAPLAQALIKTNPDRILWGSDWPHSGPSAHLPPKDTVHPFHPADDRRAVARLAEWAGGGDMLRRILVANPARLYDFPPEVSEEGTLACPRPETQRGPTRRSPQAVTGRGRCALRPN
jgi:hypothetical protein